VVEIGTSVAAPMAAQILGDVGADVIKVERPGTGDDARNWAPPYWGPVGVTFLSLNRSKRSLALDFKDEQGREVLHRLLVGSDVLIQNLRPGALTAAGFGPERLTEINPRLIYCDLTGFGAAGPLAGKPAYDPLLQAFSGIVSITGDDSGAPARVPVSVLDIGTGMWTALAVFEALRRREVTGRGCHVELSLLQTALTWLAPALMGVMAGNPPPERLGSGHAGVVPYGAFPSSDGWIFISAGNDATWTRLCRSLDAPELLGDERFTGNVSRASHRAEVNQALAAVTSRQSSADLLTRLEAAGVPCSPVNTVDRVLCEPQVAAIGALRGLPRDDIPDLTVINPPFTFDGAYPRLGAAPPRLGAHTKVILHELGYEPLAVQRLVDAGVVELADPARKERSSG